MLALLIIAHPDDTKFKNIIVKLQIEWMLTQDREILDVREGFWKGVNASNLYKIFSREEEREAEVELLADYDTLFREFMLAQKDIRPYLQEWARGAVPSRNSSRTRATSINVVQSVQSSDEEVRDDQGHVDDRGDQGRKFSAQNVDLFRKYWNPPAPTNQEEVDQESRHLAAWLAERLASVDGQGEPLPKWCLHWRTRLDDVQSYQEQMIIQSLFRQSVRRLYSLHAISTKVSCIQSMAATQHPEKPHFAAPLDVLYMVADMEDRELRPPLEARLARRTASFFQALPLYRTLEQATRRLIHLTESASPCSGVVKDMAKKAFQGQMSMLYYTTTTSFSEYFYGIMAFEILRKYSLIEGLDDVSVTDEVEWWRARRDLLFSPNVISSLKLTAWQLQAFLLPGADCRHVLTHWQDLVFRSSFCESGWKDMTPVKMENIKPMPLTHDHLTNITSDSMVWDTLLPLFGKVDRPECVPLTPRILTPEPFAPATAPRVSLIPTAPGVDAAPAPSESTASSLTSISTSTSDSTCTSPFRRPSHGTAIAASSLATSVDTNSSNPPMERNAFSNSAPHTSGAITSITPNISSSTTVHTSIPSTRRPSRSTPATGSSPARSLSRQPSNPPMGRNAFSGQAGTTPAKRTGSPLDLRQPKLPRIGFRGELDELRQDLRKELEAHREELRAQREGLLTRLSQDIKASEEQSRTHLGGIRTDLGTVTADLENVKVELASTGTSFDGLKTEMAIFRSELLGNRDKATQESQASIQQLREEVRLSAERQDHMISENYKAVEARLGTIETNLATTARDMLAEMKEMRSLLAGTRPRPEDTGYLSQICPAPDGESQRAYESRLFRACLFYIYALWDPIYEDGGGVGQNEQALEEAKQRFPDLDEEFMVKAIKYFHRLVFNRPLGSEEEIATPDHVEDGHGMVKEGFQD